MVEALEIEPTELNVSELKRMVSLIPQTDPTSLAYGTLLQSIERFIYFANALASIEMFVNGTHPPVVASVVESEENDSAGNIIQFSPPVSEDDKFPDEVEETETDESTKVYDSGTVKSLITKARADKKIGSIKEWISTNFGVDGFSAIPAKQYPQVMAKLEELGVS